MMSPIGWLIKYLNGGNDESDSGSITVNSALTYAPLYYGVRKITNNFSMLPCNLMKKQSGRVQYKTEHASYMALSVRPNAYQTPFVFKQQFLSHAILWGNGRAYVHRGPEGLELIPLMPDRTITAMVEGQKWHACRPEHDDRLDLLTEMRENPNETVFMNNSEVIHLPGFTVDGVNGLSLVGLAKQSIGMGLDAEKHSSKQLKKGYSGGLMLEAPEGAFRQTAEAQQFLEDFRKNHEGADNAGKVGLLRNGVKANIMSMSNSDAQFIEQRKFQRQEAALWLGLESILGDDNSVSYNSLEQKILSYLMNCLGPWLTACEQEFNLKLLTDRELKSGFRFKFNDGALLRSDKASLADFATKMIASKVYNPNEIRYHFFDENPYDGGDEYANPATSSPNAPPSQDSEPQTDEPTQNRLAVEETLRSMFSREAHDAINGTNKGNFLDWIDKYYAKWTAKLADKLESIGLDRDLARVHCEESREILLGVAGDSKPDELKANVMATVATWKNRVNSILEGETCSK
jgi:HK97 family phage portal protein